jgi:hypothetical protein
MGIITEGMPAQVVVTAVPVTIQGSGCIRILKFLVSGIWGGGAG